MELIVPSDVWERMWLYVTLCPIEISGIGEIEVLPNGNLRVKDIYLLAQRSSAADTELDPSAVNQLVAERVAAGSSPAGFRFWWHSHNKMAAFWSGTDEAAIRSFGYTGWWVSVVMNHKREYKARLDIFPGEGQPFRLTSELKMVPEINQGLVAQIEAEIADKVRGGGFGIGSRAFKKVVGK